MIPDQHEPGGAGLSAGEQSSLLRRELARLTAELTGRGPAGVQITHGPNELFAVLTGTLTKSEERLIANGQRELVAATRRALFKAARPSFVECARNATGRDVAAVLGDHDIEADVTAITFVLAPRKD